MKLLLATVAILTLAGCASSGDTQVAGADCKVAPATAATNLARARRADTLEQRQAEADLRSMENRRGPFGRDPFGTVEEVQRDCNRR